MSIDGMETNAIGVLAHGTGIVTPTTHRPDPLVGLGRSGEDLAGGCDVPAVVENGVTRDDVAPAPIGDARVPAHGVGVVVSPSVNFPMPMVIPFT